MYREMWQVSRFCSISDSIRLVAISSIMVVVSNVVYARGNICPQLREWLSGL